MKIHHKMLVILSLGILPEVKAGDRLTDLLLFSLKTTTSFIGPFKLGNNFRYVDD